MFKDPLQKWISHFRSSLQLPTRSLKLNCLSCNKALDLAKTVDSKTGTVSKTILKETCLKCILPESPENDNTNEKTGDDILSAEESFPFCGECTALVGTLTDVYNRFKAIEKEFNEVRGQLARQIIKSYLDLNKDEEKYEDAIFNQWQICMGISKQPDKSVLYEEIKDSEPYFEGDDVKVKIEVDEDVLDDTEELEQSINEEQLCPSEIVNFHPVLHLGKLSGRPQESTDYDSDSEDSNIISDCVIEPEHEFDESEENFSESQVKEEEAEELYVPLNITTRSGRLTRARSKAETSLANEANEIKSEDESIHDTDGDYNQTSDSIDSEVEYIPTKPTKRKYTHRKTSPAKKKPKVSKKVKKEPGDQEVQAENSEFKIKKKRIRKKEPPVQCNLCNKWLARPYSLVLHMRTHTGEKPFKCSQCDMSFYKTSNLDAHMFKHTKELPLLCDLCPAKFSQRSTLRNHKYYIHNIFHGEVLYECKFCLRLFPIQAALNAHIKSAHATTVEDVFRRIWCYFCEVDFESLEQLDEHKSTEDHAAEKKAKTERDNSSDVKMKKVRPELRKPRNVKPKESGDGDEEEESKPKRERRKRDPSDEPSRPRVLGNRLCEECNVRIPNRRLWLIHQRKFHPSKNYICEICGKNYSDKSNLLRHVKSHSLANAFVCEVCGEKFKHNISLKQHMTKHTGDFMFKCNYCPSGFLKLRICRKHMNETHAEIHLKDNKFICRCCHENFETEEILNEHYETLHSNLKCTYCGKYFAVKMQLARHVLLHTGEKPHKCSYCSKSFTQEVNLKEHEYRHTGLRPHKCTYCDAGFLRRKELQKHIEKNHPDANVISNSHPTHPGQSQPDFTDLLNLN